MSKNTPNDDLVFQNYLLVFFDLIGQREALRKITGIPITDSEKQNFLDLTKKSIGHVLRIRSAFDSYFNALASHVPNTNLVPIEHRDKFIECQKTSFHYYGLSDAVVIAVPLMGENENCTAINSVHHALTATCGIALLALSMGIPARAGIDVGVATKIDDREIYGSALARAVHLEGQIAEYPRLVVGEELRAYLNLVENQKSRTIFGKIASGMAERCRELMVQDTDGRIILDYLGKNIMKAFENKIEPELIKNAMDFITEQHKKYIKTGNDKLSARYYRMIRYFKSRLDVWGLE